MVQVVLAAALGGADADPIYCQVDGTADARLLDEGLEQQGAITVVC